MAGNGVTMQANAFELLLYLVRITHRGVEKDEVHDAFRLRRRGRRNLGFDPEIVDPEHAGRENTDLEAKLLVIRHLEPVFEALPVAR